MRRLFLAAVLFVPVGFAQADEAADLKTLKAAGITDDGKALIDFFVHRTLDENHKEKVIQLIKKLGADEFTDRQKAFTDLKALGGAASSLLRQAIRTPDQDVEVLRSCERLLKEVEQVPGNTLASAAARRVGHHKPEGLAAVLLAYLPFADDEDVTDNVQAALAAVAWVNNKANPTLEKTLADGHAFLRAAAAEALLLGGTTVHPGRKSCWPTRIRTYAFVLRRGW